MGRTSKEHKTLTKPVLRFLIDRESTAKNLKVCRQVLESILKSRASERKNMYKEQLDNIFKNLCVSNSDKEDLKKKVVATQKDKTKLKKQYDELSNKYFRLLSKTSKN